MQLGENRLGNFSFVMRRVFVGCALVPCVVTVADYCLRWELFGRFGRWIMAASFALLVLVMRYLGPTVQEVVNYRNDRRANR